MSVCCRKSLGNASYSLSMIYQCRLRSVLQVDESLVQIAATFPGLGGGSGHRVHEKYENGFYTSQVLRLAGFSAWKCHLSNGS